MILTPIVPNSANPRAHEVESGFSTRRFRPNWQLRFTSLSVQFLKTRLSWKPVIFIRSLVSTALRELTLHTGIGCTGVSLTGASTTTLPALPVVGVMEEMRAKWCVYQGPLASVGSAPQ